MSAWRLEWLRLVRTPRAIALVAVYVIFGLGEPVLVKYLNKILGHAGGGASGIKFTAPPPVPSDGISAYVSQVSLLGLIAVIIIAVGAFNFDARQGLATFLRARAGSMWQLVTPRFAVNAAAAVVAYLLGTLAAWYETSLLIGSLPAAAIGEGAFCGAIYLVFAVALSALTASFIRSTPGAAGVTAVLLIALPIAGSVHSIKYWLPSTLVNAPVDLLDGTRLSHYLPGLTVTIVASAALLATATTRLRTREV